MEIQDEMESWVSPTEILRISRAGAPMGCLDVAARRRARRSATMSTRLYARRLSTGRSRFEWCSGAGKTGVVWARVVAGRLVVPEDPRFMVASPSCSSQQLITPAHATRTLKWRSSRPRHASLAKRRVNSSAVVLAGLTRLIAHCSSVRRRSRTGVRTNDQA